ncbi:MAG: SDR family oxidoreductase [Paludibacter sp.]|jgi:NAD(P)-dependent dehydrogenase (short-subunit alcohol dehydrogenase family)|nr:SDR family oxidoreductase [Paludibacter sp.]
MENLFNVNGKVMVITGGAGILGRGMCEYMCSQGAKVAILDLGKDAGETLQNSLTDKGYTAKSYVANVLNAESLEAVAKEVLADFGTIDIIVNAAGGNMGGATIGPDQTILDLEIDAFRKVVDLNLFGTVMPTMVLLKLLKDNKQLSIINISSESALRPLTRVVGYGAAKAAVTNFTKFLATELATKFGEGFRVNAMAPGFFLTEQNRTLMTNPDGSLTARGQSIIAHTPFGRFGSPDELFGTLHWLASDASKFVTGTLTVIDGGFDVFCI